MAKRDNQHQDLFDWLSANQEANEFIQLALLGYLTRKVIHESNNQLTGILGYLTLAQKNAPLSDNIAVFLKRTIQCCESSQSINNQFLDFFRMGEKSPTNTSETLMQVITFCQKTFDPNCAIRMKESASLPVIAAPESLVRLIFLYLFVAASNEISERGEIQIDIDEAGGEEKSIPPRLSIVIHPHQSVSLKINPNVSSPASITSDLVKDMCLAMAHQYARQCGGDIVYENHTIKPAQYKLFLPISRAGNKKTLDAIQSSKTKSVFLKAYRIVLLEDQPIISDFIRSMLNQEGHHIDVYGDGSVLAECLPSMALSSIDLFMLDICVPGANGIEVGSLIRKIQADAKIVFYSALRNESDVLEFFSMDEKTRFLQKPFKKEELFDLIHSLMAAKE